PVRPRPPRREEGAPHRTPAVVRRAPDRRLSTQKERRDMPGAPLSIDRQLPAVDIDVADVAASVNVALKRQVGRLGVTIPERAISADAVRAVAVVGDPAAACETADAHAGRGRRHPRDAEDPGVGAAAQAEELADDAADTAGVTIIETVLDCGGALLCERRRVHAVALV